MSLFIVYDDILLYFLMIEKLLCKNNRMYSLVFEDFVFYFFYYIDIYDI